MKLEVGKKYTDGHEIVEVAFFDHDDTAWGLDQKQVIRFIDKSSRCLWRDVTDTPDPGEGWRLLDVDEDLEVDDEWFCDEATGWVVTLQAGTRQGVGLFYRRRIAPQYVPYTWEDREELRGRWYRKKGDNSEFMVNYVTRHNENDIVIGPWSADEFLDGFEWLDGTPCGKKSV
jgi:hypothetical protein